MPIFESRQDALAYLSSRTPVSLVGPDRGIQLLDRVEQGAPQLSSDEALRMGLDAMNRAVAVLQRGEDVRQMRCPLINGIERKR